MINFHQIVYFVQHFFTAKRNGHGIHSPFAFDLCEEVFYNEHSFYDFELLRSVRQQLWDDSRTIEVTDYGAGSKTFKSNQRRIKDIARNGISSGKQSEIFFKLINCLKFNSCIELGTSLGLNTLYLAKANPASKIYTIEGSKNLCDFAIKLAQQQEVNNIKFINDKFDDCLPDVLEKIDHPFLMYVDGNHSYEATLRYFYLALTKSDHNSVIIFDDIYWSAGMTEAWEEIKRNTAVRLSVDTFYFGFVFFRTEVKEKIDLRIYL